MYIIFLQKRVSRSVKSVHTNLFPKTANCINLQLPIVIFKKLMISDMHHRKAYMYINFQQYRVGRSIKIVRTNLLAQHCKLHKFATCNLNFEK